MPSIVVPSTQAEIVSLEGKKTILWEAEWGQRGRPCLPHGPVSCNGSGFAFCFSFKEASFQEFPFFVIVSEAIIMQIQLWKRIYREKIPLVLASNPPISSPAFLIWPSWVIQNTHLSISIGRYDTPLNMSLCRVFCFESRGSTNYSMPVEVWWQLNGFFPSTTWGPGYQTQGIGPDGKCSSLLSHPSGQLH